MKIGEPVGSFCRQLSSLANYLSMYVSIVGGYVDVAANGKFGCRALYQSKIETRYVDGLKSEMLHSKMLFNRLLVF